MSGFITARLWKVGALCGVLFFSAGCARERTEPAANPAVNKATADPLASWNDSAVKSRIHDFVRRVTQQSGADFVPVKDRIATFDNDGTLWAEQPVVEGLFMLERLKTYAERNPAIRARQPYKAFLEKDKHYLASLEHDALMKSLMEVLMTVYTNVSREEFQADAFEFFRTATYPKPAGPIRQVAYQPMLELLAYLRSNGFQTWMCSGGTTDFMRAFSEDLYGIPPEQVIGSRFKQDYREIDGRLAIWRKPALESLNDKAEKAVNIALHIGRRPIFVGGNVRSGGDIGQMTYSQGGKGPSLQVMVNHDDAEREFAYAEADNASLNAAKAGNWVVVSMKNDWKVVFSSKSGN